MAQIIQFRQQVCCTQDVNNVALPASDALTKYLSRYQWHFGRDAYWHFVRKKNALPTPEEARGLSALLGHKVKAANNKYYGSGISLQRRKRKTSQSKPKRIANDLVHCLKTICEAAALPTEDAKLISRNLRLVGGEQIANQLAAALNWSAKLLEEIEGNVRPESRGTAPLNQRIPFDICR
jgi:hypothetical protein